RYAGRIIRNVNTTAKTPLWMKEKLRRLGVRSLSPVVDVTNYILLELGQPMHAFDLDKLQGGIQARYANEGEQLVLLDDQTVTLTSDTLVIADDEKAVALAGIKGGMATAVSNTTQNIFLESAHFRAEKLRGQARRYGLQTDASYRFERGVAADLPTQALERATQLIVEICGGSVGPVVDVCADDHLLDRPNVNLRRERIARILGVTIEDKTVEDILRRLGCEIAANATGWTVKPPHSRFDITIEEDLIEELARVYGYDNIPAALKALQPKLTVTLETENPLSQLRAPLIASGYQEAVTYSFVDPTIEGLLSPGHESIVLANPISAELSHMRSTVWSGLLRAVEYNLNRQQTRVRLFEVGPVFSKTEAGIQQQDKIAGIITGLVFPEQWSQANRAVDFYDIKGDVEAILAQASAQRFYFVPVAHPALHPGQSAEIATDKEVVGWVGALHPALEAKLGFGQNVFLFELDLKALQSRSLPKYQAVSKFPMIRRDLALVVDRSVLAIAFDQAIAKVAPPSLIRWEVFDVYTGKGIAEHQKSVAISLILQEPSRTLEDSEITRIVGEVMASLQEKTGATLR
ncbi:MAG TPA: phenylalanine--tRNA ligase subunit beta, partial [Thiolinea sp.]|nr:phenylalanine--tRNA ligase subunit beta [Thiolinea sp.]